MLGVEEWNAEFIFRGIKTKKLVPWVWPGSIPITGLLCDYWKINLEALFLLFSVLSSPLSSSVFLSLSPLAEVDLVYATALASAPSSPPNQSIFRFLFTPFARTSHDRFFSFFVAY